MKLTLIAGLGLILASGSAASAQTYGHRPAYNPTPADQAGYGVCPPNYHETSQGCVCDQGANFYSPYGGGYYPAGPMGGAGGPAPYNGDGQGYSVHFYSPGVRVTGQPVDVASGQIYVQGAPVYVQAPPVHVAAPQVYLERPTVYVRPSQVTVDPPVVHAAGCPAGESCSMVGTSDYDGGHW